jgi:hypothetical protein
MRSKYDHQFKVIIKIRCCWKFKGKNDHHFGFEVWSNILNEYSYGANQELIEHLITRSSSSGNRSQEKYIFEKDEIEKCRSTKIYEKGEVGSLILKYQRDSFFTAQNCLRKENIFYYDDGTIEFGRSWDREYITDCQLYSIYFSG